VYVLNFKRGDYFEKKSLILVLVLSVSLLLTACGNAEDKAQGEWVYKEDDGEKVTMEIEDSNAEITYMGLTMKGEIEKVEKNNFSLKLEDDDSTVKFKVKGKELKDEDGNTWKKKN
jgi:cytochrome c-type biogenesis protein CcmE